MNTAAQFFKVLIRLCGGGALVFGLAFWLGYGHSFTRVHMALGMAVVVSLWTLAWIAGREGARTSIVVFATGWGVLTWAVGVMQVRLLPGSLHWMIAVVHLLFGAISIALGGYLANSVASRSIQSSVLA